MNELKLTPKNKDIAAKLSPLANQFTHAQVVDKLVKIALAEVGVREDKKNNTGARILEYQKATSLKPGEWPWCAAFTAFCMREWLRDLDVQKHFGLQEDEVFDFRCRSARAFSWQSWAENKGFQVFVELDDTKAPAELVQAGDIIIYNFSHIGIAVENQPTLKDRIVAVEGNTNGKGERDSTTGDGVWIKKRNPVEILCIVRMIKK